MLRRTPSLNLIVGSDQGIEGAVQAVRPHPTKVVLIGYGASSPG